MSKKPLQTKLFKKFQDDEIHAFTHRPSIQTDKLIEESINSDLSFSKEDSFSITNLKQDWDSIKVLQADIKKTSEKLKKLGNHPPRPLSECAKTGKIEKKTKNEGVSGKELKKTQDKCKNLAAVLAQCEKEKKELNLEISQLRKQLEFFSDANSELKAKLHDSQSTSKKTAEILKYGQFITKKIREIPKWEEFFSDRTSQSTFISQIKSQKFDEVLLKTLQFTSDIIVHSLKSERSSIDLLSFCNESEKNFKSEESENLLLTINAQSERIAKLNRQISEAMISSKELLYSPLAPVVRGNSRNSRSICYSSSNEFNPKNYFSTPDRWRLEKNVIAEQNVDEETSGKPLG